MSLVPDYDVIESSDSENDSTDSNSSERNRGPEIKSKEEMQQKLPTPAFVINTDKKISPSVSIFSNPFTEAENAKTAILEKHVKMVNRTDNSAIINGKKICWNYRKGKCRFGHNCKYAHDSELQKSTLQLDAENHIQQTVLYQSQELPQTTSNEIKKMQTEFKNCNEKRKRPGLTQGLVPGKKVMKTYFNNKK